ncbi:MAG: hypothetical protein GY757_32415 [bacterium]|nr:hypothetical protein [bacterium]
MGEFSDLIPEFVEESLEHLKNIEEDIIIIEQGTADNDLINRVFRAVHSIKGGSSFLGLKNIEQLSHKMEDIFNLVRNNDLDFTSQISSRVLTSIDTLKDMLESSEESDNIDISQNLKELQECLSGKAGSPPTQKLKMKTADSTMKLDKYTFENMKKQGKKVYHCRFELKEKDNDNFSNPLEFFREIEKTGEILEQGVDMQHLLEGDSFIGEGIPLSIIYATVLEKDLIGYIFGIKEEQVIEIKGVGEQKAPKPVVEQEEISVTDTETEPEVEVVEVVEEIEEEEEEEDVDIIGDKNEYLTFLVGEEEYGIGITQVHEIVTMQEITKLPKSDNFVMGILNLRGDIIPVYDFRLKLKFEEREYDSETIILIVMLGEKRAGIVVDRVSEVIQFTRQEITDAPQMQDIPAEYVIGIGQKEDKFILLLKVSRIFSLKETGI